MTRPRAGLPHRATLAPELHLPGETPAPPRAAPAHHTASTPPPHRTAPRTGPRTGPLTGPLTGRRRRIVPGRVPGRALSSARCLPGRRPWRYRPRH
ncbi:hypothetical protein ACFQ0B_18350 [Nonomuraea thailandensis]